MRSLRLEPRARIGKQAVTIDAIPIETASGEGAIGGAEIAVPLRPQGDAALGTVAVVHDDDIDA
jgi:hypothetical protein